MSGRRRAGRLSRARILVALVVVMAAIGISYAVWNAAQPHVRLFVVNESVVAGSLRFADGSVVAVPACSSARYSDDPTARWTLTSATRQLARLSFPSLYTTLEIASRTWSVIDVNRTANPKSARL